MNAFTKPTLAQPTSGSSSETSLAIAKRLRRELHHRVASTQNGGSALRPVVDFLHQPFRQNATLSASAVTDSARHLLKLLAPLLHQNLGVGHRNIDRGEPVAHGFDCTMRWLSMHSKWPSDWTKAMLLHSLMPLYLHTANEKGENQVPMVECVGLLRDLVALTVLDEVLEGDLAQWVVAPSTCWNASTDCLSKLGVRIHELSRLVWHDPLPVEISANAMKDASAFSVSDARRVAFWSIVQQWLSDSSHIAIPKELSIDRLNWPTMKTHFRQWHDLHTKGGARASANDSARDGGSLDLQPAQKSLELVEECLDAVDQALQPGALGGASIGGDVPGREPCIGNLEAYRKDLAPGEKSQGTKTDDELTIDYEPNDDDRVVEIRSSSDPKLVRSLDQQLSDCRVRQGSLALVVARTLHRDPTPHPEGQLAIWQRFFVEHLRANSESDELRGFVTSEGEIAMLLEDLDKPVAAAIVREALQEASAQHRKARGLGAEGSIPLIAGLSFVSGPARSFQIKQLIDAGWRCLEGAANQGSGSVKSLEVY